MEPTEAGSETKTLGSVVQIDEGKIQAHLDELVRATVEETLNRCWMRKPTSCAERNGTSGRRARGHAGGQYSGSW